MKIICIEPFGELAVGDTREIPDGSTFSEFHFKEVKPESEPVKEEKFAKGGPIKSPVGKDKALGKDEKKDRAEAAVAAVAEKLTEKEEG